MSLETEGIEEWTEEYPNEACRPWPGVCRYNANLALFAYFLNAGHSFECKQGQCVVIRVDKKTLL